MKHLILGGARSGKSHHAETTGLATGKKLVYIATSQALDDEMQARIQHHQTSRDARWKTIEEPIELATTLQKNAATDTCILVDCLTLWLTNHLLADHDLADEADRLDMVLNGTPLRGLEVQVRGEDGAALPPGRQRELAHFVQLAIEQESAELMTAALARLDRVPAVFRRPLIKMLTS